MFRPTDKMMVLYVKISLQVNILFSFQTVITILQYIHKKSALFFKPVKLFNIFRQITLYDRMSPQT